MSSTYVLYLIQSKKKHIDERNYNYLQAQYNTTHNELTTVCTQLLIIPTQKLINSNPPSSSSAFIYSVPAVLT